MFAVFDENKSWYYEVNKQKACSWMLAKDPKTLYSSYVINSKLHWIFHYIKGDRPDRQILSKYNRHVYSSFNLDVFCVFLLDLCSNPV